MPFRASKMTQDCEVWRGNCRKSGDQEHRCQQIFSLQSQVAGHHSEEDGVPS